ncbi:uncharacterized protein LOC115471274 isoform X2 [Microcaecilia unicolor]|uniref:Uncharacterized protein LOC115471274 isoform X2 n=1 Tax=Microcaecilia unicolor TaxID=1415580 RepID=A0A6P7XZR3_9AMPH|nr:uncharacterized protein LOC115471274 isoform X2 [Microcaecilia unicolor]
MDEDSNVRNPNLNPYWCNICKISCASALNLQTHFLGFKHKKVEEALKAHGIVKSINPLNEEPIKEASEEEVEIETPKHESRTLDEWLASCKGTEPALGLEYIVEYRSKNNIPIIYECKLCECEAGLTNMFMHVGGVKHRLAYLKKHHPVIANSSAIRGKGSELSKRLSQIAMEIEKKEGRKKIEIVMDFPGRKRKYEEGGTYNPDSKLAKMDFTSDDVDGSFTEKINPSSPTSAPAKESPANPSFQDLKKAYSEIIKLLPDQKVEPKEISRKNTTAKKSGDQTSQETNSSFSGFTCNKDLFDYLQNFEILSNEDAVFILKVTQKFTDSLIKYREDIKAKNDAEASNPKPVQNKGAGSTTQKKALTPQAGKNLNRSSAPIVYCGQPVKYNINQQAEPPQITATTPSTSEVNKNILSSIFSAASKKPLGQQFQNPVGQPVSSSSSQGLFSRQNPSTSNSDTPGNIPFAFPNASKDKNEAMSEFFNSIKDMEVSEVTATLNQIASTNPAFRGIDVSSVIRILVESGRLKSASGTL